MGTNESSKEQAPLEQRRMDGQNNASSVQSPFEEHPELKESNEYFEQYKMKEQGTRSVNAWSDFYDTEDLLDVYLEKQGYPTNHDIKKEKSAA